MYDLGVMEMRCNVHVFSDSSHFLFYFVKLLSVLKYAFFFLNVLSIEKSGWMFGCHLLLVCLALTSMENVHKWKNSLNACV